MADIPEKNRRSGAVQGLADEYTGNSFFNQLSFIIDMAIHNKIATAAPVKVVAVEAAGADATAGYIDALPLVCPLDAEGNTVGQAVLYHLPYFRLQGGKAAIISDPVVGDIGLCVFCKQDTSNVTAETSEPQQPGSFRTFNMADGFYLGGFLNQVPSVYIELTQDEQVKIKAPSGLNIETNKSVTIRAGEGLTIYAPKGVSMKGNINVDGEVTANNISLSSHLHGGVQSGGGNTGEPV